MWLRALGPGSLVPFLERLLCDLRFATCPLWAPLPPLQNTLNSNSMHSNSMQMWRCYPVMPGMWRASVHSEPLSHSAKRVTSGPTVNGANYL